MAAVREHATVRLGFSWLLPDPWAQDTVTGFEEATGDSVSLIRCDDPLAAIGEGRIDVALVRGEVAGSPEVRVVHLFDETRIAVCAAGYDLDDARGDGDGDNRAGFGSGERDTGELDWNDAPRWTLVVNTVSGTTGPWSWPDGKGPRRIVPTANFDEWLESVAAGRGLGIVPDVAQRRSIHPGVRFLPLRNAPLSRVSLAFRPGIRESLLRRFVQAALNAV
jgi:DNA-binding transcriptional LysR family regulator